MSDDDIYNEIMKDSTDVESPEAVKEISKDHTLTNEQVSGAVKEYEDHEKYGDSSLLAGTLGAARGITFGLSDAALEATGALSSEELRGYDEQNEAASTIGEVTGVIGGAILTGGESLVAKGIGAGIKTATKAGLAAERISASALQRIIAKEGKKSLIKNILAKSVSKTAGLTVEGMFYSTGHLVSENALGRADINAENVLSAAKEAATFGALIGVTGATYSAVLPKIKNGKIVGWTKEKLKGKKPTNIDKQSGAILGLSEKDLHIFKTKSPKEYANLGKHLTEELKWSPTQSRRKMFQKNQDIIEKASIELNEQYVKLDGILKNGDDLGLSFAGSSNKEVAESLTSKIDKWIDENIYTKDVNGKVTRRAGITDGDIKNAHKQKQTIKDLFGVSAADKTVEQAKALSAIKADKVNALNVKKFKVEQNIKLAEEFKNVPALKSKLVTKKASKSSNVAKTKKALLTKDKRILDLKTQLSKAKDKNAKDIVQRKIKKVQLSKDELKLKLREVNSKIDQEISSLNLKVRNSPKVKEPKFFKDQLKSLNAEITSIEKKFIKDSSPLFKKLKKFNATSAESVSASKMRQLRDDWKRQAKWGVDGKTRSTELARAGYKSLNDEIQNLANLVSSVDSSIGTKIFNANLKSSTALKVDKHIMNEAFKNSPMKEGAIKTLVGTALSMANVPFAFLLKFKGAQEVMKGVSDLKVIEKLEVMKYLEKSNKVVERKVESSLTTFFKDKVSKTVKPLAFNTLMKSDLSKSVNEETSVVKNPKNRKEAFKNVSNNVTKLLNDQEALIEKASESYPDFQNTAPETKQQITQNLVAMVQYLDSKLPKNSTLTPNNLIKREWSPSDLELSKFEKILEAVQNPLSILDDLKNGTITREAAEAIRVLKPQLYAQIQQKAMQEINNSKETIPYQKRLILGILLDIESDASLNGQNIAGLQELHNEAQESQAGGSSAFRTDKIKADKLDLAESSMGGTEATAKRK